MIIKKETPAWNLEFTCSDNNKISESQKQTCETIFSIVGDAISALSDLNSHVGAELLHRSYKDLFSKLHLALQETIANTFEQQYWLEPLEGKLSYTELFGRNLIPELIGCLDTSEELASANEAFPDYITLFKEDNKDLDEETGRDDESEF